MRSMQRRADVVLPAAAAALVAAAIARDAGARLPAFLPIGDFATYDAATPAVLSALEPVAHAPWHGAPGAVVTATLAAVVALTFLGAARWLGASLAAAAIALAAFVVRPDVHDLVATGAPALASLACVWGAVLAAGRLSTTPRAALWGAALLAAATAIWPPALVLVPMVAVWCGRPWAAAALAVAGLAGAVLGVWRWTALAAAISGDAVTLVEAWRVVAGQDPRGAEPYVWPRLAAARLPVVLMAAGLVAALARARLGFWRGVGLVFAALVLAPVPLAWREELVRAWYWAGWPFAALGVEWLAARASARGRVGVLAAVAVVFIGGGVSARLRQVEAMDARAFSAALTAAVPGPASGVAIVAEDPRVDSALVAFRGASLARLRPSPELVERRSASGSPVWAGPSARTMLELWGLRFTTRTAVERPAPFTFSEVAGRFRCVPVATAWRELPGLEYTGRLGVHLPAGRGRFETVVVGSPPGRPVMTAPTGAPRGRAERLAMDRRALPGVLWPDRGAPLDPALVATKFTLDALEGQAETAVVALGSRAPLVAVRFVDDARSTGVAIICAAPLPRDDGLAGARTWPLRLDDRVFFAAGWHGVEFTPDAVFRWTTGQAVLLLPSMRARAVTLHVDAQPAVGDATPPTTITAVVNGWAAGTHAMTGTGRYAWALPDTIWVDGTNEIRLEISRTRRPSDTGGDDTRELGARVTDIRLSTAP